MPNTPSIKSLSIDKFLKDAKNKVVPYNNPEIKNNENNEISVMNLLNNENIGVKSMNEISMTNVIGSP